MSGPAAKGSASENRASAPAPPKSSQVSNEQKGQTGSGVGKRSEANAREATAGGRLVVVKFFEADCHDCQKVGSIYDEMVKRFHRVLFLEANVQENLDAAIELRVRLLPTFIAFKDGEEVGRLIDASQNNIESFIRKYSVI